MTSVHRTLCFLALSSSFVACATFGSSSGSISLDMGRPSVMYPESSPQLQYKALLIGIDGLRPDAMVKADTPTLDALAGGGAYTLKSETSDYTWSGPGWSSVLTGVWPEKHGVKNNTFVGRNYGAYPCVFTRIETLKLSLKTAAVVNWGPLKQYLLPKVDALKYSSYAESGDTQIVNDALKLLSSDAPDLTFVYFQAVDMAGHEYGFHPDVPEYMDAIERTDASIGELLTAVSSRSLYAEERWLTIVTTDHGGTMEGHGGTSVQEKTVFYIVNGDHVKNGELLPPASQVDVVPTILRHLKIVKHSKWNLDGTVRGLDY